MIEPLPIGALSRLTGVKVPTIRYYEGAGILPAPCRADNNRRTYGPEAVRRLRFIRQARDLGFQFGAVRQLLALADDPQRSCREVDVIARAHLADIDDRISMLSALRDEVRRTVEECAQGLVGECRIIEMLADPGQPSAWGMSGHQADRIMDKPLSSEAFDEGSPTRVDKNVQRMDR